MIGHLSDRDLLLYLDGESTDGSEHLERCLLCRGRLEQLEQVSRDFHSEYHKLSADGPIPLKLEDPKPHPYAIPMAAAAALLITGLGIGQLLRPAPEPDFAPAARLTPGATRPISVAAVCSAADRPSLRRISNQVADQVFRNYGIRSPKPRSYEIDYLIPPDLGGSEDPRNLWPQPYARGVWTARVKDALEDRLRSLVCEGKLDLATAQRELARDWIGAYKRYFRTDKPLLDHIAFSKDRPWE